MENQLKLDHLFFRSRKDIDDARINADEKQVKELIDTISEMIDPFKNDPEEKGLANLSSGVVAPADVITDLTAAFDRGNDTFEQFVSDKLLVDEPDIFSPISKLKLKTFASSKKTVTRRTSKGQIVSLKADRSTFARLFMIGQKRSIDVPEILSYCLGPYPLSLANTIGNICKTPKSKLLQILESEFPDCVVDAVPVGCAVLLDAMAVLQSTVVVPETFGELADSILSRIVAIAHKFKASRVDFVADRYPEVSIKNAEREKRASQGTSTVCIYGRDQKVFKPWKKFLSNGSNKENLVAFLLESWSKMDGRYLGGFQLYVTSGKQCTRLISVEGAIAKEQVDQLSCDHEEADTRLLLHAAHAATSGHQHIVIKSPDTDVFILTIFSKLTLPETSFFFNTGTGDWRFSGDSVDVISSAISPELSCALPGLHAFTGKTALTHFVLT